jgi:competence protein ComEA
VRVGTGQRTFQNKTLRKAIDGTGWDGTVVLGATANGAWRVVTVGDTSPALEAPLVNLDTATVDEFMALPMVGRSRARAIVADRPQRGPFVRVDDLQRVADIGPGTMSAIRHLVTRGN